MTTERAPFPTTDDAPSGDIAASSRQGGAARATDALQHRAERARDVGDEWLESTRTAVREHPVMAVGVALAAGALIARMTQR